MEQIYTSKIKIGLLFLMFTLLGHTLYAQALEGEVVPFVRSFPGPGDPTVIRGDMKVIGNSILGIRGETEDDGSRFFFPNEEYNGTSRNNGVFRGYIDIDSDASFNPVFTSPLPMSETEFSSPVNLYGSPITSTQSDTGTFSSSAAELTINNPLSPPGTTCSTVVKAFLYWGAMYEAESLAVGNNDGPIIERPDCTNPDGTPCEYFTEIKILPPGASEYIDIKANNSGADFNSLRSEVLIDGIAGGTFNRAVRDEIYVCKADVTSLFTELENQGQPVEGNWTVANVRAVTGAKSSGSGGGWSLVVVYEDPLATFQKNISMFEGYVAITRPSGQLSDSVEFNITGFETIPTGPVNVDLATISLEGDIGIFGDRFEINDENDDQTKSGTWIPMTYPGQDASNFFDCSIYSKGPVNRFPNSSNTLGYDSDHFTLLNPNNEYISNGDNEADFRIFTQGDAYGNFFNAFAIEVIAPDLDVVKKGFRPDSSQFDDDDLVDLGDQILYRIDITNNGNDDAVDITFVDILPINTVFQNNITLNGEVVPLADITIVDVVATDNLTGLDFDTQQISFTIDDELLEIGESVRIEFTVNVVEDCSLLQDVCTNQIQNQADVTYFGEVNDNNGTLFEVKSAFEVDGCGIGPEGPTVILADQTECFIESEEVTQCSPIVELEGGEGFVEYRWFFEGVQLTTDANGVPVDITSNTIVVGQTGTYTLEAIRSTSVDYFNCRDVTTTFEVEVFDPLSPPANPFEALGEPLDPVCADDGTQIIGIQICNDPIEILTNFPDDTTFSWQKYDPASGCTQSSQNCPFTSATANCYVEEPNGTESSFTLSEEGSYRLSVIVEGGCQFDYYFDAVPIDISPVLSDPQQNCDDDPVFIVSGVDLTTGNIVNYELEFEVTNQGVTQTFPPDAGTLDRYTLPRVTGEGYTIKGIVTPDVEGICSFETNEVLFEFIDLSVDVDVLNQAICFDDFADIIATAVDGFPSYVFNLMDGKGTATEADDTQVQTSGSITETSHRFDNIIPGNAANYYVEVFAGGTTSSPNCRATDGVEVNVPIDFTATASVIKPLTCEPAEVTVNVNVISLGTTSDPDPQLIYTIGQLPGNVYTGGDILLFDDESNRPDSVDEDEPTVILPDGRIINYLDFTSAVTLDILVFDPDGNCSIEREVTITPYDFPEITVIGVTNINCNGDSTGEIRTEGLTVSTINLVNESYEIIAGPELRPTQASPVFSNLPAGLYTIQVTDVEGCTDTIDQELAQPEALEAPVIETTSFTCEADAIISITTATQGGSTPYEYQLFRNGTLFRTLSATDMATANAELATENLTEGTYDLRVTDDEGCNAVISNELIIDPLPEVALTEVTPRSTDYVCTTPGDTPLLEITVQATVTPATSDTIEGYRISSTTDTTGSVAVSANYTNTTGVFNLPEGTHVIESRTVNTLCTETITIIVDPYVELTVDAPIITGVECFGDNTGIIGFTVNNFSATAGYSYDLTFEGTSVASSPLETTATITLNGLAASNNPNDYVLTVTDLRANNCTNPVSFDITISGPTEPQIDNISAVYDCTADEYVITIAASGGTGSGYTFTTDTPATTQNSTVFTLPAPATNTTVTVGISDSDTCEGQTATIDLDAITELTANLDPSSDLCNVAGATQTVVVNVTSGEGVISYQLQGTTNIQTSTVTNTGLFTIANPETNPGTYVYEIFDDNHTELACAATITYTIDPLFEVNGIAIEQPDCSATTPAGSLPTDGSSITFNVEGGDGAYTYAFTPSTVIVANSGTLTNPIFVFDDSFDGDTISITVNDGSGCTLVDAASITVEYPEPVALETTSPSFSPIECNGDETTLTLDPVGADGNFEYSFDGGVTFDTNPGEAVTAGTINYVVRNITTECTLEGSILITEPDAITVNFQNMTNITCSPTGNVNGSFELGVVGGTGDYNYELYLESDRANIYNPPSGNPGAQGPFPIGTNANFTELPAGEYIVTVTDANGCTLVPELDFQILPTPDAGISAIDSVADCTNRVTLFFEVLDGSNVGDDFFVSPTLLGTLVDPSIPGDSVFQIGDTNFPTPPGTFTPTAAGVTNRKVFAISNIDFDIVGNFIVVLDNSTNCTYSKEYDTEPSDEVAVTATGIAAGSCDLNSGAVDITFSTVANSTVDIEVFRVSDGASVSTPITRTTVGGVPQTETLTGLPTGSLRVRVQQTGALQCNATAPFQILVAPPLEGPIFVSQASANCNQSAQLEVRANNGNENEPYTYALAAPGTDLAFAEALPDVNFVFTEVIDFSTAPANTFADSDGNITATVFVRDFNGCTAGPLSISIPAFPAPDVVFDLFSTDECEEEGPFTFGYTIDNYDSSQTYTLTVDGGVEQTLPPSATGTYQVTTRGDHEVVIFGDVFDFCTATQTVNVPDVLVVEANLSEPDCDGNIAELVVEVSGGYDPTVATNRLLTYVLTDGTNVIATLNSTSTTETFTSGTGALGTAMLDANTNYTISVTDTFDSTVPVGTERTCIKTDMDTKPSVLKPTFVPPTLTGITCGPTTSEFATFGYDGVAQINIAAGFIGSITYELYEFPAGTSPVINASTYTSDITNAGGNNVTAATVNASVDSLFEGLRGESEVEYLVVALATGQMCPVVSPLFTIPEPAPFTQGFTVTEVPGTCEPFKSPTISIALDAANALDGNAPYFYRIPGLANTFTEFNATTLPLEIAANAGTFSVELTDASRCNIISLPIILNEVKEPEATIVGNEAFNCNTPEELVTITITNAVAGEQYSIINTRFITTDGTVNTTGTLGDSGVNPLAIDDFDEAFTITAPGLYEFTYTNITTGCEGTITYTIDELEQLTVIAADSEVLCNGDTTGLSFEVLDYVGDFNYSLTGSLNGQVATGTVSNFGTATPSVVPATGSATIDASTGIVTVTDLSAEVFTIDIAANDTTTGAASVNPFCSASIEAQITQPDPLMVGAPVEIDRLSCVNTSAIIQVGTVTGGTPPYSYELVRGTTTLATNDTGLFDTNVIDEDGDPATASTYFIRVSDANPSCPPVDSDLIAISSPVAPLMTATSNPVLCEGDSTSITVTVTNTTAITADAASLRYSLFLYDAAAPDFKGIQVVSAQASNVFDNVFSIPDLTDPEYVVQVADDLGCFATQPIDITDPTELSFTGSELLTPISCDPLTEEHQLFASGGTGTLTYERYAAPYTPVSPPALLESNTTGIFNIIGENYFRVVDANGCDDLFVINTAPIPAALEFDLSDTAPLCFGESGGNIDIVPNTLSGGVGNYEYNIYDSATSTTPLVSPAVERLSADGSGFSGLVPGTYFYEVTSGACPPLRKEFTILQFPELTVMDPGSPRVGCPGEDDAVVRLQVNPYPVGDPLVGSNGSAVSGSFTYIITQEGSMPREIEVDTNTEAAVFEFLGPGVYTYFVVDNGTQCNGASGTFTVTEPDPLVVMLDDANSQEPVCEGDTGSRTYNISGGTPPYYAFLIEDSTVPEPRLEDLLADQAMLITYLVPNSDTLTQADVDNGVSVPFEATNLLENNLYRLIVFDSGNGLSGDDLRLCEPLVFEFEFETDDLGLYEVSTDPDCVNLGYTVGIDNNNPEINDEDLMIRIFTRNETDGSDGIPVGDLVDGETLIVENVPAGTYNVYLESTATGCTTITSERQFVTLEPFSPVQFITLDNEGNEIQPFRATNEINVYVLQVTGGVNPSGVNPYSYEATFVPLDGGISGGIVDVDSNGIFRIEEPGFYTFKVIDNYGDEGVSCFDLSNSIGLNVIDIDVPNVFNPASDSPSMNTWFPENLTTSFSQDISPIIDPNPDDGVSPPEVPGIVTTTNGTVTGGTVSGGTTSGGVITGGTVTGGSTPVSVTDSTTVTEPNGAVNTVTIVTTGGTVDTNGNIIGGTSIITTTSSIGVTTVEIATGVTISGGTTNTNGTVTGGTIISEDDRQPVVGDNSGGVTTYTIVTGGTIIGGTTTGITTTGGTTVFSNTTVNTPGGGAFVTTDGITTGGLTTGGATSDAFVTTITVPTTGGGNTAPTIDVSSGVTVTGGTITGVTITGATITGGMISGGVSTEDEIEFLDYENMQVFIFDRYGRLLKEILGIREKSAARQDGWDGTYQGKEMPSGDYWYLIKLNDPQGREFTGHFTLYRR